jgi:hypothetical protein
MGLAGRQSTRTTTSQPIPAAEGEGKLVSSGRGDHLSMPMLKV